MGGFLAQRLRITAEETERPKREIIGVVFVVVVVVVVGGAIVVVWC